MSLSKPAAAAELPVVRVKGRLDSTRFLQLVTHYYPLYQHFGWMKIIPELPIDLPVERLLNATITPIIENYSPSVVRGSFTRSTEEGEPVRVSDFLRQGEVGNTLPHEKRVRSHWSHFTHLDKLPASQRPQYGSETLAWESGTWQPTPTCTSFCVNSGEGFPVSTRCSAISARDSLPSPGTQRTYAYSYSASDGSRSTGCW